MTIGDSSKKPSNNFFKTYKLALNHSVIKVLGAYDFPQPSLPYNKLIRILLL